MAQTAAFVDSRWDGLYYWPLARMTPASRKLCQVKCDVRAHQMREHVAVGLEIRGLEQLDFVRLVEDLGRRSRGGIGYAAVPILDRGQQLGLGGQGSLQVGRLATRRKLHVPVPRT